MNTSQPWAYQAIDDMLLFGVGHPEILGRLPIAAVVPPAAPLPMDVPIGLLAHNLRHQFIEQRCNAQ